MVGAGGGLDAGPPLAGDRGVVFSVIGAFYYLRVIKLMYFDEPEDSLELGRRSICASFSA